jgi:ABC-type uncharacterized transport system ATPase subunit
VSETVLELHGITKIFPGVKALDQVEFNLKKGEIHALMGENGAGKSTFIKVIMGVHQAEEGQMLLDGQPVRFKSPKDAQKAVKHLRIAANAGHAHACFSLAECYESGEGVQVHSEREALALYKKAAAKGHAGAVKKLAELEK